MLLIRRRLSAIADISPRALTRQRALLMMPIFAMMPLMPRLLRAAARCHAAAIDVIRAIFATE